MNDTSETDVRVKFARFLVACRYILIIPVLGCVLLTTGIVIMGVGRIVTAGVNLFSAGDFSAKAAKNMSLAVIEIIDFDKKKYKIHNSFGKKKNAVAGSWKGTGLVLNDVAFLCPRQMAKTIVKCVQDKTLKQ